MPTSSITKNFIISDPKQAERFANAVEESYRESLLRKNEPRPNYHLRLLTDPEEIREFMRKRETGMRGKENKKD